MATFCLIFFPSSFSIMFYEESKGRSLYLHFPCQMIIGFVSSLLTNLKLKTRSRQRVAPTLNNKPKVKSKQRSNLCGSLRMYVTFKSHSDNLLPTSSSVFFCLAYIIKTQVPSPKVSASCIVCGDIFLYF